ncbi:peptidase S28 [Ochromonadaceae sp. CCMP2298]|nr:peptidase S28 [Ochromonadaceae sp. CCMP2298]|mmetsp:Transcript_28752/g.63840  ORF Transcript_28752/g.63840 Transcript_28752/m.63840 type:complete len:511 (-) Transcript_28752:59-1591(-)
MLLILLVLVGVLSTLAEEQAIGFGVQRLKNYRGHNGGLKATTTCADVDQYWFKEAVVDNFAPVQEQQLWAGEGQRYWVNRKFWAGTGAPILVYIGGEGEESCSRLTDHMYAYQLAEQHKALLVDVEHRFYGQSYPTPDMSTENLRFLSADQALADLARIIGHIKTSLSTPSSRIVTIGGSYPGCLSAWFRLKYPSVTAGSIASSAPLLATTNFGAYMDVVGQSLIHFGGQGCFDAMRAAAESVAALALQAHPFGKVDGVNGGGFVKGSKGVAQLQQDFSTCSDITSSLDMAVFMSDLMGNVQGTVQYNNEHAGTANVTDICAVMTQSSDYYANFVELQSQYRAAAGQQCEDASWADTVTYLSDPTKDGGNNGRPWTYQTCNEFGYYQTTDSSEQPFASWLWLSGLSFSRAICSAAFDGWTADPAVTWTNQEYGALGIAGTNILFPSGSIDPWHALSVTNYTQALPQPSEAAVYIEGTAHCADLYAPANSDPASLTYARSVIAEGVAKWLA